MCFLTQHTHMHGRHLIRSALISPLLTSPAAAEELDPEKAAKKAAKLAEKAVKVTT